MVSLPLVTRPHLLECHDRGTIQRLPAMPAQARAVCPECDAHLRHTRTDPFTLPLALNLSALVMLGIGAFWSLLSVSTAGQFRDADLLTGLGQPRNFGLWELAVIVLIMTFAALLVRILCMAFGWVEQLRPWSVVEIFLLGLFMAHVRLGDIAHIDLGAAILAPGTLTVTMLAAEYHAG